MRREFRQLHAVCTQRPQNFFAIVAAFRGASQIEKTSVPCRDLHAFVAEPRSPFGDFVKSVERRLVVRELCQKNCRSFDRPHLPPPRADITLPGHARFVKSYLWRERMQLPL